MTSQQRRLMSAQLRGTSIVLNVILPWNILLKSLARSQKLLIKAKLIMKVTQPLAFNSELDETFLWSTSSFKSWRQPAKETQNQSFFIIWQQSFHFDWRHLSCLWSYPVVEKLSHQTLLAYNARKNWNEDYCCQSKRNRMKNVSVCRCKMQLKR